jgi:hypothetical protein
MNKLCAFEFCQEEIPNSNALPDGVVIFCFSDCYMWDEIQNE